MLHTICGILCVFVWTFLKTVQLPSFMTSTHPHLAGDCDCFNVVEITALDIPCSWYWLTRHIERASCVHCTGVHNRFFLWLIFHFVLLVWASNGSIQYEPMVSNVMRIYYLPTNPESLVFCWKQPAVGQIFILIWLLDLNLFLDITQTIQIIKSSTFMFSATG